MKLAKVNVEEYLIGRERLRQLIENGGDKVETLALLHSLLAKFSGDPDVQGHIADVYLKLANIERAERHYETMYRLDGGNRQTGLKYAAFLMQHRDPAQGMAILEKMRDGRRLSQESRSEIMWLSLHILRAPVTTKSPSSCCAKFWPLIPGTCRIWYRK